MNNVANNALFGRNISVLKIRRGKKMDKYHVWLLLTRALSDSLWLTLSLSLSLFPAPSGAHRLTRSLLESLRRCYIAPVFPALVLDNHHNHYLDSHLDDKPRCCSPVRVALSVDSDLHLGTGVRERSRLIPRLRCTPRVISQRWLLKDAAVSPMARTVEPSLHKRPL